MKSFWEIVIYNGMLNLLIELDLLSNIIQLFYLSKIKLKIKKHFSTLTMSNLAQKLFCVNMLLILLLLRKYNVILNNDTYFYYYLFRYPPIKCKDLFNIIFKNVADGKTARDITEAWFGRKPWMWCWKRCWINLDQNMRVNFDIINDVIKIVFLNLMM